MRLQLFYLYCIFSFDMKGLRPLFCKKSSGYAITFSIAGADLKSAPSSFGSVIRFRKLALVVSYKRIENPELKDDDYKSSSAK